MLGGHVADGRLPEWIPQEFRLWTVETLRLEEQRVRVVVALAPCCCIKVKAKIWCTHRCGAAQRRGSPQPLSAGSGLRAVVVGPLEVLEHGPVGGGHSEGRPWARHLATVRPPGSGSQPQGSVAVVELVQFKHIGSGERWVLVGWGVPVFHGGRWT